MIGRERQHDGCCVYIAGMHLTTPYDDFTTWLSQYGRLQKLEICNTAPGKSPYPEGHMFAFATFKTRKEAVAAKIHIPRCDFNGRTLLTGYRRKEQFGPQRRQQQRQTGPYRRSPNPLLDYHHHYKDWHD